MDLPSSLLQAICVRGFPRALHTKVTAIPSVARVSELLSSSIMSGGTAKKFNCQQRNEGLLCGKYCRGPTCSFHYFSLFFNIIIAFFFLFFHLVGGVVEDGLVERGNTELRPLVRRWFWRWEEDGRGSCWFWSWCWWTQDWWYLQDIILIRRWDDMTWKIGWWWNG